MGSMRPLDVRSLISPTHCRARCKVVNRYADVEVQMLEVLLGVVLAGSLVALADVASSYESELRSFTRAHWMRSVMVPVLGPLLWIMYGRPRIVKAPPAPSRYQLANTATDDNPAFIAYLGRLIRARRHQAQG
jgi:hypothetical protein